jgi:spore germination protein YaaH
MDFEGIYAENRAHYTAFLNEIASQLKPLGYSLTVSVPAKTYDNPLNSWNGAYDYAAIGKIVDQVIVMTYDEHYPGGSAGPVASIGWVNNVANYILTVVPANKILLGVAAYGYDWSSNGCKAYSMNGCINLANNNNAVIQWDNISQCPYFYYMDAAGTTHEVWFESSQSAAFKLDLVNNKGIAGIAIWRLGLENTDFWNMLKSKF